MDRALHWLLYQAYPLCASVWGIEGKRLQEEGLEEAAVIVWGWNASYAHSISGNSSLISQFSFTGINVKILLPSMQDTQQFCITYLVSFLLVTKHIGNGCLFLDNWFPVQSRQAWKWARLRTVSWAIWNDSPLFGCTEFVKVLPAEVTNLLTPTTWGMRRTCSIFCYTSSPMLSASYILFFHFLTLLALNNFYKQTDLFPACILHKTVLFFFNRLILWMQWNKASL